MPLIYIEGESQKHRKSLQVADGTKLSDVLRKDNLIDMPCGGHGRCGKCRVRVTGELSALSTAEKELLTKEDFAQTTRLACCTSVEGDCTVVIEQHGEDKIAENSLSSEQLFSTPELQSGTDSKPLFAQYGACIDIGTTTLAARLFSSKGLLSQASQKNPQIAYGSDVLSRVESSLAGKGAELARTIRAALCSLLIELAQKAEIAVTSIDTLVLSGNTTMFYLLTNRNPQSLSCSPFEADHLFGQWLLGSDLELPNKDTRVYLPHCMSAFVGADITNALLASNLTAYKTALLTDIGTNGESALYHNGKLTVCSAAAGPAFEGANIAMGMSAKEGAIDRVDIINGKLYASVIGNTEPVGICGSGIIDALACMLKTEEMDSDGNLDLSPFMVMPPVSITQEDVRMVQFAKGAMCAGITTLLQESQVQIADIEHFFISGGFGSYMNIANAAYIGLFPKQLVAKAHVLGNSSLAGSTLLLQNKGNLQKLEELAKQAQTIDLATSPLFAAEYPRSMLF